MIYLTNTTDPQAVFVPRNDALPDGSIVLKFRSTIDKDSIVVPQVTTADYNRIDFRLYVVLPQGTVPGEYEYALEDSEHNVISKGLAIVRESVSPVEYDKTITYEQYLAD